MSFSLPRFLRSTPLESLKLYFDARSFADFPDVDWAEEPLVLRDRLSAGLEDLSPTDRDTLHGEFERAGLLCDEVGQRALRDCVSHLLDVVAALDEAPSNEARALLVLLHDEDLFEHATATAFANRFASGRTWTAFKVPAGLRPTHEPAAVEAFKRELSGVFKAADGSGRRLVVEKPFERRGRVAGQDAGCVLHLIVYLEGVPETETEFDGNDLRPRVRRPAVEAAICHDPESGGLDVVARGGKQVREAVARAYARHLLNLADDPKPVRDRSFGLDKLKRPMPFPTIAEDGVKEVRLTRLRLAHADSQGRLTIEWSRKETRSLHEAAAEWFGPADPLRDPQWYVTAAKLTITCYPEAAGRREKTFSIELRQPNGSNLREHSRLHQMIAETYLPLWGLVEPT